MSSFLPGLSQGIKEVHVQNIQHRDSPELMVSHYFLDEQLYSNDVFGFVLKISWQLAWELVPSTLGTFFESILNIICHCLGIFFSGILFTRIQQAGWISTPSTGLSTPLLFWTVSPHSSTTASTLPSSWQLTVVSNFLNSNKCVLCSSKYIFTLLHFFC